MHQPRGCFIAQAGSSTCDTYVCKDVYTCTMWVFFAKTVFFFFNVYLHGVSLCRGHQINNQGGVFNTIGDAKRKLKLHEARVARVLATPTLPPTHKRAQRASPDSCLPCGCFWVPFRQQQRTHTVASFSFTTIPVKLKRRGSQPHCFSQTAQNATT